MNMVDDIGFLVECITYKEFCLVYRDVVAGYSIEHTYTNGELKSIWHERESGVIYVDMGGSILLHSIYETLKLTDSKHYKVISCKEYFFYKNIAKIEKEIGL